MRDCITCKHFFGIDDSIDAYMCRTKDTCQQCGGEHSKWAEKTQEDSVNEGIAIFERKMTLPQYAEYINNENAKEHLLRDCIREALFRSAINAKSIELLAAKKASAYLKG